MHVTGSFCRKSDHRECWTEQRNLDDVLSLAANAVVRIQLNGRFHARCAAPLPAIHPAKDNRRVTRVLLLASPGGGDGEQLSKSVGRSANNRTSEMQHSACLPAARFDSRRRRRCIVVASCDSRRERKSFRSPARPPAARTPMPHFLSWGHKVLFWCCTCPLSPPQCVCSSDSQKQLRQKKSQRSIS